MTDPQPLMQSVMQGGWDAFQAAGQQMLYGAVSFICEMAMVAMVFVILLGVLFHFSHYRRSTDLIVHGIIAMIVVSCIYMAVLGASGPPDISLWFKPPV